MPLGAAHVLPKVRRPPYLPFLNGPAAFSPGLTPLSEDAWLLPDTEASAWMAEKRLLMKLQRSLVSSGALNGDPAEEVLRRVMQASGDVPSQKMPTALEEAASLVSDDLCILEAKRPHDWRLTAGVLCAPTYWTLPERIGLDLGGLHGPVPGGDPGLASRISRIFSGLQPGRILERFNWTVQIGGERFTPERPRNDGHHAHDLYLRVERQTVSKLPQTGAVLFTIRICVDPLVPILALPHHREAFEDAWLGTSSPVRTYKHWRDLETLVAKACRTAERGSNVPT